MNQFGLYGFTEALYNTPTPVGRQEGILVPEAVWNFMDAFGYAESVVNLPAYKGDQR